MRIKVKLDGQEGWVDKSIYVAAKTKDLKEYGYKTLTEDEVEKQLDNVLEGKKLGIIGMFIETDIVKG